MRLFYLFTILLSLFQLTVDGQVAPLGHDPLTRQAILRMDALYGDTTGRMHTAWGYTDPIYIPKGWLGSQWTQDRDSLSMQRIMMMHPDLNYIKGNPAKLPAGGGFWRQFYRNPYVLWRQEGENFSLSINPLLHLAGGDDRLNTGVVFQNSRGLRISGTIDKKLYFATDILENQQQFFVHNQSRIRRWSTILGQGFYKNYQSRIWDDLNGFDFLNASGYVGLRVTPSIDMRLGHGRHFIGYGERSMLLNDAAQNYFYLSFTANFWKIQYQTIFAELAVEAANVRSDDNVLIPKKYMATHYLDLNISKKLSIGLFESIVFSRSNHFEFQYLNPVILYRSVEQFLDSPDNAFVGVNMRYNWSPHLMFYGQLMVDEFRISEVLNNAGWWGNKWGIQMGLRAFDILGIEYLDAVWEYNTARPYTYTHRSFGDDENVVASYTHHNQPLAHPLGANFKEWLSVWRYQIKQKWYFQLRLLFTQYGDSLDRNVGHDILLDYDTRIQDFGNYTGQGQQTTVQQVGITISRQLWQNYFFDFQLLYRNQKSDINIHNFESQYWGLGFRANVFQQNLDY